MTDAEFRMMNNQVEQLHNTTAELFRLVRESVAKQGEMAIVLAKIETKLEERKECPAPGLCLDVRTDLIEARKDIADLKTVKSEFKGVWKMVVAGSGLVAFGAACVEIYHGLKGN